MIEVTKKCRDIAVGDQLCYWPLEVINSTVEWKHQKPVSMSGTVVFFYPTDEGVLFCLAFNRFIFVPEWQERIIICDEPTLMVSHIGTPKRFNGSCIE